MQKTNISNLKKKLSSYLRKVRAGETVLVLYRDRPIACIVRVTGSVSDDARIAGLEAAGLIRPPIRPMSPRLRKMLLSKGPLAKKSVLAALLEERAEGR